MRQLMGFTAVMAIIFGIGRAMLINLESRLDSLGNDGIIFAFLGIAAIVITLPLVLAALLPRFAIAAVLLVLLLIALATAVELPLLNRLPAGGGPNIMHFVWINFFTAASIVVFVAAVRLSGYRLTTAKAASTPTVTA